MTSQTNTDHVYNGEEIALRPSETPSSTSVFLTEGYHSQPSPTGGIIGDRLPGYRSTPVQDAECAWESRGRSQQNIISRELAIAHRQIYERTDLAITLGFSEMIKSMRELESQIKDKLFLLYQQQQATLESLSHSSMAPRNHQFVDEFADRVKRIDRSLDRFSEHANNLGHVKLTLARAAIFVNKEEGEFAKMIPISLPEISSNSRTPFPQEFKSVLSDGSIFSPGNMFPFDRAEPLERQLPFPPLSAGNASILTNHRESIIGSMMSGPSRPTVSEIINEHLNGNKPHDSLRVTNATCFVFHLPQSVTSKKLRELFAPCGTVMNAYVVMDKVTGKTRGYGFVDFSTPNEARTAVDKMDKYPLEDKFLSVSIKV